MKMYQRTIFLIVLLITFTVRWPANAQTGNVPEQKQSSQQANEPDQANTDQYIALSNIATPIYAQYVDTNNGMTVESLVTAAGQRSKDLLAARQNIAIISGRLIQAGLRPNPTIDAEYGTDKLGTRSGEYDLSLSYIQPIELAGKRKKRQTVAQLELAQAEKELAAQEQKLTAEIRTQYAEALAATENLRVTEQLVALNEQTFRVAQVRFNQGDIPKLDVNLTRVELNRLRTQQLLAESRVKTTLIQLKTLAGLGVDEPIKLRGELFSNIFSDTLTLESLQTAALQNRPDLQAARIGEDVAAARINLANAEAVPDLNIFGRYQQDKSVFDDTPVGTLADTGRKVAFGVSIPLPIFNKNQGTIAEAAATRIQAQHRREYLEQIVKRDVALAVTRLQTARESIELYKNEILPRSQDNLRIIRIAYDLGDHQLLDLLSEQRRLVDAQQQYTDSLKEYYLAIIELDRAVGAPIK
jgi:outer membrane protein, heavy metal efflux system